MQTRTHKHEISICLPTYLPTYLLVHSSDVHNSWDLARLEPGACNPIWVFHLGGMHSSTWAVVCCFLRHMNRRLDEKRRSWDSNRHSVVVCRHPEQQLNPLQQAIFPWFFLYYLRCPTSVNFIQWVLLNAAL